MFDSLKKLFSNKIVKDKFGIAIRQTVGSICVANIESHNTVIQEYSGTANAKASEWLDELLASGQVVGQGYIVLSNQFYTLVQIDKPDLPEEEIIPALKWLVKDIVPIEPDDMMVDYTDAPVLVNGMPKINVVCTHLSLLKNFTSSFKRHNITLKGIITESVAFANLVPISQEPVLLICQQPYEDLIIMIIVDGQIYFNRYLRGFNEIGGYSQEQLSNGICDSLSVEIQKSLDFFERQLKQKAIKNIKVLIPVANEQFIIDKLAANTLVPVSTLKLSEAYAPHRDCAASIGGFLENGIVEAINE